METVDPKVLMVSAECRDLAKVGGLADVVRDLSKALRSIGISTQIVMPCYDRIKHPAEPVFKFTMRFGTRDDYPVEVFSLKLDQVPVYLIYNQEFFSGDYGDVYIDSERLGRGPFEDDALRFAFFSSAVLELLLAFPDLSEINALHCHDWHTGFLLTLLKYSERYQRLSNSLRTLFTIHNLDYQGTRPFDLPSGRALSSFSDWFPELYQELKSGGNLTEISDRHSTVPCFNPMRAGINLADAVNTVSPNYAQEITLPDDEAMNFIGGRGLEEDLRNRGRQLYGILNGLDYESNNPSALSPGFDSTLLNWQSARREHKEKLLKGLAPDLENMAVKLGKRFKNSKAVLQKIPAFQATIDNEKPLVVAITRAVRQKVNILLEQLNGSGSILDEMLKRDIFLLILGTGDLEDQLEEVNDHANGLFVCAFDPDFANLLYVAGDIFLMPSDFEPCGISQMIAMRYGCLPIVPAVGGLKDTVQDMVNGFVYHAANRPAARRAFLDKLDEALDVYHQERGRWETLQVEAMAARFEWSASAMKYLELYRKR